MVKNVKVTTKCGETFILKVDTNQEIETIEEILCKHTSVRAPSNSIWYNTMQLKNGYTIKQCERNDAYYSIRDPQNNDIGFIVKELIQGELSQ